MPELPEVEVICRGLRPHLLGQQITAISQSGKQLRYPVPFDLMQREMLNRVIIDIQRRAKYIQFFLDNGAMLILHLGMTGNLGIFPQSMPPARHDHLFWSLANGEELRYHDVRRFGFLVMLSKREVSSRDTIVFQNCGPEPLSQEFHGDYLHARAKGKQIPVKSFLMDNRNVVGIGNIYANESLFHAGIRPAKKVSRITKRQWHRLADSVRAVLTEAIHCGGSTISDFRNASQQRVYFQINFKVYGRTGEKCLNCQATIQSRKIGGRASFYCPHCQL